MAELHLFFNMTIEVPANTVISSGTVCRYGRQTGSTLMIL